jgi:glycosyltransferase involved in cell wall biosynthesis
MKIKWVCPHQKTTGYGSVAIGMTSGLKELGHEVSPAGNVGIYHSIPFPSAGGCDFIYTMFEHVSAPWEWGKAMDGVKAVFTGSKYSMDCLQPVTKTRVIPIGHGVDVKPPISIIKEKDKFVFLSVAENVPRKFLSILADAFELEFEKDKDVVLDLKSWSSYDNVAMLVAGKKRVRLITGISQDMSGLFLSRDAYVLPSVEGWGMTQMEAIALGIKPIVLDFGGVLDYCDDYNCYKVKTNGWEQCYTNTKFEFIKPYMKWQKPNVDDLRRVMRSVRERGVETLNPMYVDQFKTKWKWKNVAAKLIKEIESCGVK